MRKHLLILSVIAMALLPVFQVQAKVTVSERVKYFKISGKTGKQLFKQIRRRAPAELRRKNWMAATYASYNFKNMKIGVKGDRCVITSSNIHLKLTYHYPKWSGNKGSSKNVRKHWDMFSKGLKRHEKVHGRIYREMLQAIDKEVRAIRGNSSDDCRRYVKAIERKITAIEKRYDRKQDAFDRKENQSRSQISKIETALSKAR